MIRSVFASTSVLLLASCSQPSAPGNTLPGSNSSVTIEKFSEYWRLNLPKDATQIEFGLFASIDTGGELKFLTSCAEIHGFINSSGFPEPTPGPAPSHAVLVASRNAWTLPSQVENSEDQFHARNRLVTVGELNGQCQVIFVGIK